MHAEGEGEFATVVEVVFDEVPEHPLAREGTDRLAGGVVGVPEEVIELGSCPAVEGVFDDLPGDFKSSDEFRRRFVGARKFIPFDKFFKA